MKKTLLGLASAVVLGLWGTALQAQQMVAAGPGGHAHCVSGVACAPAQHVQPVQQVVTAVAPQPVVVPVTTQMVVAPPCANGGCTQYTYEITRDAWCGNGCDTYPVSHRSRELNCDNNKVEYRHHIMSGAVHVSPCRPR